MDVPEEVAQFVRDHIDSVAELEALLLMRRERHAWTPGALAERLYVEPAAGARLLDRLNHRRFVRITDEGFAFDPPENASRALDQVAELYSRLLIPITRLIHSKPSSAVRSFADAFRLRDEE